MFSSKKSKVTADENDLCDSTDQLIKRINRATDQPNPQFLIPNPRPIPVC